MRGHGEKRSRKQEAAIIALLAHPTIPEAAKACGVGESTLWRWLQDPDFQAAYRDARRQVVEKAVAELQAACSEAVAALVRNLNCKAPQVEVSAARAILERAFEATENEELKTRIKDLEEKLEQLQAARDRRIA